MLSPEQIELDLKKAELDDKSHLLAEKELNLEELKNSLIEFQQRHYAQVAVKYVELDRLKAKIAELKYISSPHNHDFKKEFEEMKKNVDESFNEYGAFNEYGDEGVKSQGYQAKNKPSEESKNLYRKIASMIHPDKATDEESKLFRTNLMKDLNSAYADNDIDKIKAVLTKWQESPDLITGTGIADELIRTIRSIAQVNRRLSEIDDEVVIILESDIYVLMKKVQEGDIAGRDILLELSLELDGLLEEAKTELSGMMENSHTN